MKQFKIPPSRANVVIQGFGNVGGMAARLMAKESIRIVAIIEVEGAVYNENGLDIQALTKYRHDNGSIVDFPESENLKPAEAMSLHCDVLLPAAKENVITAANAGSLNCKIICEGANGPTTAPADHILAERGIFVIPDILANAGGVTVSYFEWVQDRQGYFWNEKLVNSRLEEIMTDSFYDVIKYANDNKVDNRTAAYMLALDRVAFALKQRGLYA